MLLILVFLLATICAGCLAFHFYRRVRERRHLNQLRSALDFGSLPTRRKQGFIPHRG